MTDQDAKAIGATHRHVKRGTYYRVVELSIYDATNATTGRAMVLYFPLRPDGQFDAFVRETSEFNDGRFVKL